MLKNVSSCQWHLRKNQSLFIYHLREELQRVSQHDYLGVTISNDLNWSKHCLKTAAKASRTLGMLRRTLSACSADVKALAYLSLVRPQLEYGSEAWNPYTNNDVKRLENIQRQAALSVFQDFCRTTSVTPLTQQLQWDSLQTKHLLNPSVMFYKIQHQLVNITFPPHFQHVSSTIRRNNSLCYQQPNSNVDVYAYSFYPRTIRIWNRLPEAVVCAPLHLCLQAHSTKCHECYVASGQPEDSLSQSGCFYSHLSFDVQHQFCCATPTVRSQSP